MSGVLITRPQPQAEATQNRLKAAGYSTFLAPLLEIEGLDWAVPDITPQAILLTSQNAIPALAASAMGRDIPVYAVGDRTAAEAMRAGFTRVESASGDARALIELVQQRCGHGLGALLYLCGEAVAGDVAARLSGAGYWVDSRICYRASAVSALPEPVKRALLAGDVSHVLLYSPRSAAIFSRLMGSLPARAQLSLVCLSGAVAQAAGSGWQAVTTSDAPDEEKLIEALLKQANMV